MFSVLRHLAAALDQTEDPLWKIAKFSIGRNDTENKEDSSIVAVTCARFHKA